MGIGLRAVRAEAWLLAPAVLVGIVRRALLWPAWAVGSVLLVRAAVLALTRQPLDPSAPISGVLEAATSPRFVGLVGGLFLGGLLCGAALRIAFLAGAFPTLAAAASGRRGPVFASGVAYRTPAVLATAALGFVVDVAGALFSWTLLLAALRITLHVAGGSGSAPLAAAVALAVVLALAVPLCLSTVSDTAVARAGVAGEGAGRAFAGATRRFLARPGTFLLAAMLFGLAAAFGPASVEGFGGGITGLVAEAPPILLAAPTLVVALAAAVLAAAIDLWWLGTVAALGVGEDRG